MDEQQPQFRAVHFHMTEGAQSQMMGGLPLLYVGISYHIPKEEIEEAQRIYDETRDPARAQQIIEQDDVSPDALLKHVSEHGFQPLPDAVLERFDTVDSDTGDMLVLLRVPCIPIAAPDAGQ
ncbi:MAG: hypothetical protein ACYDBB_03425 [Armatimonadota bacterium]